MPKLPLHLRMSRRGRLVALALTICVTATGLVIAQQTRVGRFEAFPLEHIDAGQAATQLEKAFGNAVEVIPDTTKNRLLVSTNRETTAAVQQFIRSLDQPATQQPNIQTPIDEPLAEPDDSRRLVVAYRVPPQQLASLADLLRTSYAPESGLTVATDERVSQLLVVAPTRVQSEIKAIMRDKGFQPFSDETGAVAQPTNLRQDRTVTQSYDLQNISWREFEAAIVRTWGNRLNVSSQRDGELISVELPAPQGVTAMMNIDRRAGKLTLSGPESIVAAWRRAVQSLDVVPDVQTDARWISTEAADVNEVRKAVSYLRLASATQPQDGEVSAIVPIRPETRQDPIQGGGQDDPQDVDPGAGDEPRLPNFQDGEITEGLIGPVNLEFIEEFGIIVVTGNPDDVEKVNRIINQIINISEETLPRIELYPLANVDSQAISQVVQELYDQVFAPRQDPVTITPLLKPNALLLIGRDEAVESVIAFLKELDVPVPPANEFQVIYLKHMSAIDAKARLDEHYLGITAGGATAGAANQATDVGVGLSVRIRVTADYRSNALVVSASPRDIAEIEAFVDSIDVVGPESTNTVRILRLKNSLAEELAPVLQDVLNGQLQGAGLGFNPQGNLGNTQQLQGGFGAQQQQLARIRSVMLELVTVDPRGQKLITKSGITFDVRVTADTNSNTLIVQGPAENMDLIEILVRELDRLPDAETVLKVYTIVNGDAAKLLELLQALFATEEQLPLQSGTVGEASTLVSLRFAIDTRLNSLIVSGSQADIDVVESLLIRLDLEDVEDRVTVIVRLHNSSAVDVATAVNDWLDGRDELNSNEDLYSIYQQVERTILVIPEGASNSLILSATEEFLPEIEAVIERLDRRPPMVMIQVLLATVTLDDQEEFGIEMGIQDSLLFDRGAAGAASIADQGLVGFPFNQSTIGNLPASYAATREPLLAQGLNLLNVGRTNGTLGFGGLVLSAGNESVNLLLRALKAQSRLQVLSRPQIMTVENLQGFVQIGQRVPYITETTLSNFGQTNTTEFVDVGILLQVTPRVSPDGLMVLGVDATRSQLGAEEDGIPISINLAGDVIRSPAIDIITAQTTVMARSGQTVVLGGLIETTDSDVMRGVPILSNIPGIGSLFRFDQRISQRDELLIIMTPYLIESEEDMTMLNQMEMDRMSWCLADVANVHGTIGYSDFDGYLQSTGPATVYPDLDPAGMNLQAPPIPEDMPIPPSSRGSQMDYRDSPSIMEGPQIQLQDGQGGPTSELDSSFFPPVDGSRRQAPAQRAAYDQTRIDPNRYRQDRTGVAPANYQLPRENSNSQYNPMQPAVQRTGYSPADTRTRPSNGPAPGQQRPSYDPRQDNSMNQRTAYPSHSAGQAASISPNLRYGPQRPSSYPSTNR